MKQSIIKFSVLLMILLLSGVGNAFAAEPQHFAFQNMSFNVTYSGFQPGGTANITAKFDSPVDNATISIIPSQNITFNRSQPNPLVGAGNEFLVTDAPMIETGDNQFSYESLIPQDLMGLFNVEITPFVGNTPLGDGGTGFDLGQYQIDPYIDIISPTTEFANQSCVNFNFTGYDALGYGQAGGQIVYTFWLDGVQKNNGIINSGTYKLLQFELADGKHTYEVRTKDSQNQEHTTGTRTVYVDTKCPSVTLVSPQDGFKQVIGATKFNFTCADDLAALYGQDLSFIVYIDGQAVQGTSGNNITGTVQSGVPVTKELDLADGAHNWSVSVKDGAGNIATSEARKFYVDLNGLTVSLLTPAGGYVSANPTFTFSVTGNSGQGSLPFDTGNNSMMSGSWPFNTGNNSVKPGTGLPFDWQLLIDGKVVQKGSCDSNGNLEYNSAAGENGCVCCADGESDGSCFVVGKENYSLKAAVADGFNKNWTVVITDTTTGKVYQPSVNTFSVDSVAPAPVEHLYVQDKPGRTNWTDLSNSPGLDVYWIPNNEKDLAQPTPYEIYVSTSKPSRIEDMELVNKTYLPIDEILKCGGKPLVYGKDYWVAVIARDNATNYGKNFSLYGPIQTYEDMDIQLNEGWNLKSVPKSLVDDCPASAFGENNTVLYWDGSCWQFPDTIEPCKGYWVYCEHPFQTSVKFKGMASDCADPEVPPSLTLTPGWHMIGHTYTEAIPWFMTLTSLGDTNNVLLAALGSGGGNYRYSNLVTYNQNEGWGGIIPDMADVEQSGGQYLSGTDPKPVEALQSYNCMVPGQGYWIFMKDEGIYGSIQNVYQNLNQNTNTGTNGGNNGSLNELPDGFDLNNPSTYGDFELPNGFDLNNPNTWGGYDFSEFQNGGPQT